MWALNAHRMTIVQSELTDVPIRKTVLVIISTLHRILILAIAHRFSSSSDEELFGLSVFPSTTFSPPPPLLPPANYNYSAL